jgi:hypothetical protein
MISIAVLIALQDDEEKNEEPTAKKVATRAEKTSSPRRVATRADTANSPAKQAEKASSPSNKRKVRSRGKFPPITLSNDSRKKVIILNVIGLLCDIRPLHDRREWGVDVAIYYAQDQKVKIKKRTGCGPFLTMLCTHFEVGIWSPIDHSLLEVVAQFLASGTKVKWSCLWGKETSGSRRDLHDLFSMIPDESAAAGRCLQFDCDATATKQSPPLNVLNCVRWDPLEPNDDFLSRLIEPFEALARNPSDMEYCTPFLAKDVRLAAIPRNPVCLWTMALSLLVLFYMFLLSVLSNKMDISTGRAGT